MINSAPDTLQLTNLAVDMQLSALWTSVIPVVEDEDALAVFAASARVAYTRGYHDGDYSHPFRGQGADFGDDEIDLRVLDVFLDVVSAGLFGEHEMRLVVQVLRAAWCRGFMDGSGEQPFGPAPRSAPNSLSLPQGAV